MPATDHLDPRRLNDRLDGLERRMAAVERLIEERTIPSGFNRMTDAIKNGNPYILVDQDGVAAVCFWQTTTAIHQNGHTITNGRWLVDWNHEEFHNPTGWAPLPS